GGRLVDLPLCLQHVAQVIVGLGKIGQQFQYATVAGSSLLQVPSLMKNCAEKMNRIGLTWRDLENLPIDLLGGLQPTAMMVPDRNSQCFGNRCHDVYFATRSCRMQSLRGDMQSRSCQRSFLPLP